MVSPYPLHSFVTRWSCTPAAFVTDLKHIVVVDSCLQTDSAVLCINASMLKKHSSELPIRFGVAVRKRRLDYGWTQDELAERAGLDRSFVSGIERGTRTVSIVTLEKIADAFKLPIAELLKEL